MPAQERLSPTEQYLAYLAGLGIVVIIAALILLGLGTFDDDDVPISLLLIGLVVLIIGTGGWLYMVKPWTKFDDLKTPYYTGQEDHAPASSASEAVPAEHAVITAPPAAIEPVAVKPTAIEPVPAAEPAAEGVAVGDDLVVLEGIGPKSAAALQAAGITTFAQLAKTSPDELNRIMKEHRVKLVGTTEHWPHQAELAASGDLTALDEYMRRLRGEVVENDLTLLEGIGPKSAAALRAAGITTFAQVAKMSPADLEKIVKDQKVRLVGSTTSWPEQAALAAAGDLSGLDSLRARIKRGGLLDG